MISYCPQEQRQFDSLEKKKKERGKTIRIWAPSPKSYLGQSQRKTDGVAG